MNLPSPALPTRRDDAVAREVAQLGFAVVPDIVEAFDLERLAESLAREGVRRSRAGARHLMRCPDVNALANAPALVALAQSILGTGTHPYRATLFDKSTAANWAVVWHQDTALPLARRHDEPGWGPWSVKDGVIYAHAPTEANAEVASLARSLPPHACVVGRGGVLAMSPMLIHASSKADVKAGPRRVIHIEYARSLRLSEDVELALA